MFKLAIVTLISFLVPVLWVFGARAQTAPKIQPPAGYHARAWASTYDANGLTPSQRQAMKAREEINERISQMYDGFRMVNSNGVHYETARGLTVAAENIQSYSNETGDYYTLESYLQQIRDLQTALQVLVRLR
ncbi:MAG: hypothetical protein KF767_07940 [Bdellovibrionaceae bacterium]|nr:hypothetical protein [Pseudobdellovibrionaceae bacterium]